MARTQKSSYSAIMAKAKSAKSKSTKKTTKAKKPVKCSYDPTKRSGKRMTLCASMDKYLRGSHMPKGRGIFLCDNIMHLETGLTRNLGPVYRDNAKDGGVFFNFCPWCGSDLEKNWRDPSQQDYAKKRAKAGHPVEAA